MNRSIDGDVVVVEVFPRDQWKAPGEEVIDADGQSQSGRQSKNDPLISSVVALRDDDAEDNEGGGVAEVEKQKEAEERMDVDDETKRKPRAVQPTGRVVGVVKRNWRA